jgi:hypothetical protein
VTDPTTRTKADAVLRAHGRGDVVDARLAEEAALDATFGHATGNGAEPETVEHPTVPDAFWTHRAAHEHVRQAARARGAAPDAVLGAVLAHVALRTPPALALPPIVGGHGSLNIAVGLLGRSGTGKGTAMRVGEDLLPGRSRRMSVGPPGTGQGMLDIYFEWHENKGGKGEHRRKLDGHLFEADEGAVLSKLGDGTGSLTLEVMRLSFNAERVGTTTVGAPWRVLERHSYRMVWLLGFQPAVARPLLADTAGGTPQRFVWFGVVDPDAPLSRPNDPGRLSWTAPDPTPTGKLTGLRIAPTVAAEIVSRRHEVLTGRRIPGLYESHRDFLQLKLAGLLGVLAGRTSVTVEDWALAGMLVDTSDAVREATLAVNRADDARLEAGRNVRAANRARAEEGARRRVGDDIGRVARVLERFVERAESDVSHRDLRRAVASRDAKCFEDALAHAEAEGWVVEGDDGAYAWGGG